MYGRIMRQVQTDLSDILVRINIMGWTIGRDELR